MARWFLGLCAIFGLFMVETATAAQPPNATEKPHVSNSERDKGQSPRNKSHTKERESSDENCPQVEPSASDPSKKDRPKNPSPSSEHRDDSGGDGGRRKGGRGEGGRGEGGRGEGGRGEGGRGEGGRGEVGRGNQEGRWRAAGNRSFFDAVRRDSGPLEFMPLLLSPEIRKEIGLDKEFEQKLELYTSEMQKQMDEDRKALEANPHANAHELFKQRLAKENERFEKLLDEMPEDRRDRLIGVFVQMRNYRSLSNRLVSENKLGLSREESTKLRKEIESIREDTVSATRDRMKRIFENGGDRADFEKLFRENQKKIDARIKKKLTDAQIEKIDSLRGKEVESALLRRIEMNPPPLPHPATRKQD